MTSGADDHAGDDKGGPPYLRYAVHNPYNYALLAGVAAAALFTQNLWLAIAGAGAELLWMVFAPDSRLLRKLWFDPMHQAALAAREEAERRQLLGALPDEDRARVAALDGKRQEILRLCAENRAVPMDLLRDELGKLAALDRSFVEMAISSRRYEQYLSSVDLGQLEAELRRHEQTAKSSPDEDQRALARKNLAVLQKRREKLGEIREFVARTRGQMQLIENTFRLLADQIVTMRSPRELGGQLDELLDGVEAVRATARETEALLEVAR
jgi:hypothetical protein